MLASRKAWSLRASAGGLRTHRGSGGGLVRRLDLLSAGNAGQHYRLCTRLRIGADPLQGLVQRAQLQRCGAGHDDRRGVGACRHGGFQLPHLLGCRNQPRVGHVELPRHEVILDLDSGHTGGLHLPHCADDIDGVAEAILGVHHQRRIGDARDPAAVVHHIRHVGQHNVRHPKVGNLPHRTGQHAELVAQHVGNSRRQRVEDVGGQRAVRPADYLAEQLTGTRHTSSSSSGIGRPNFDIRQRRFRSAGRAESRRLPILVDGREHDAAARTDQDILRVLLCKGALALR